MKQIDDFVLTIEDDDQDVPGLDADVEDGEEQQEPAPTSQAKRKRERSESLTDVPSQKQKKSKRSKQVRGDAAARSGTSAGQDEVFNPDFDFDFEDSNVINTDWSSPGSHDVVDSSAGIDAIISRRRKARGDDRGSDTPDRQEKSYQEDFAELEDEETLAADAFGMEVIDSGDESGSADGAGEEQARPDEDDTDAREEDDKDEDSEEDEQAVGDEMPEPESLFPEEDSGPEDDHKPSAAELAKRSAFYAQDDPVQSALNSTFLTMSLSRPIMKGLSAVGFSNPTPIQSKTIPVALLGKDVVGGAETGSGKTGAFIIPILERLLYRSRKTPATRVAILMPTRELAVQCHNVATKLASFTDITFALIVGGLSLREQEVTLKKRPDIIIATPGRFIDHMRNTAAFAVEALEILVLDEADRMLEDGFADELNEILITIPRSRQTMLFSATMTEDVDNLIRAGLQRPVRLMVDKSRATVSGLVQEFIKLKSSKKQIRADKPEQLGDEPTRLATLLHLLSHTYTSRTIVFFPRKPLLHRAKILLSLLTPGVRAVELHGSMSQAERLASIAAFRSGTATHLLASDVASRGLDIPGVETVINFTVPSSTETYLHRVGRTARAGREGISVTLYSSAGKEKRVNGTKEKGGKSKGERSLLKPILRIAKSQHAKIRTRSTPVDSVDRLAAEIIENDEEVQDILKEEKEERLLAATERDLTKSENMVKHEDEIRSRPRRTWFMTEKEKAESAKALANGNGASGVTKERKKLSNKEKKRLDATAERKDLAAKGGGWKKGKDERAGKGVLKREEDRRRENKKKRKTKLSNGK